MKVCAILAWLIENQGSPIRQGKSFSETQDSHVSAASQKLTGGITAEKAMRVVLQQNGAVFLTKLPERFQILRKTEVVNSQNRFDFLPLREGNRPEALVHRIKNATCSGEVNRCEQFPADELRQHHCVSLADAGQSQSFQQRVACQTEQKQILSPLVAQRTVHQLFTKTFFPKMLKSMAA